ncbi:PREDICTED: uncharacterized protein LOC101313506 [Fragaria vesca subsp. vesca]|uniref:uncharacterized protein LOC101313506 n=1 Tax=Fragaria vesca subsp. vesca TaxID=101020 RepID=UPI0002C360A9|nr:PREDICTED: uncharacterized protein LOC101313506 [Fragaria vesca subsp. vesca]
MGFVTDSKLLRATIAVALAALSASAALSLHFMRRKSKDLDSKIRELEKSLKASLKHCASERQGRIRAQQALRKSLTEPKVDDLELTCYPMAPIGVIQSCFSTRNGTPRQPLIVPLSRACLIFNSARVPPASLEGLGDYTHCWVIYVFHLNTNLERLWKNPAKSKFKAKVRVPRLKGERMGVFATRSPHRPCPIGLTVAKVEAVKGNILLLSGVDLVDGTPVLDVKPYLPYCDSIQEAGVPKWLMVDKSFSVASISFSEGFTSSLAQCWAITGKNSLYASPDEFQNLLKQVLSWDIRSVSQRTRPHESFIASHNDNHLNDLSDDYQDEEASRPRNEQPPQSSGDIIYHLILEGLDVWYRLCDGNVVVEKVTEAPTVIKSNQKRRDYSIWRD